MIPFPIVNGLDSDLRAYLNRRTVTPSAVDQANLNALFKGLKTDGNWNAIDALILPLTGNAADNLLNLKGNFWNAREIWDSTNGCLTSWTNGSTHAYETFTPTGTTSVTAINTSGNGSFYSNNIGAVTTGSRIRFTYTLTTASGANPQWNVRTIAGGYTSGSSLSATGTALAAGTHTIDIVITGANGAAYFNIFTNTGNNNFTISGMKLEYMSHWSASGWTSNSNFTNYCWGSNFIPSVETTSKFRTDSVSTIGVFGASNYSAYTVWDMGSLQTNLQTRLMARNSAGQVQAHVLNGNGVASSFTGTEGLLSARRVNSGSTGTSSYSRGNLLSTGTPNSNFGVTSWELYYGGANDNGTGAPSPGSNRTISAYYIGGNVGLTALDARLNTYLNTKGLGY